MTPALARFNLISRGYDTQTIQHSVQLTETAVLGTNVINEMRFQFYRNGTENVASSLTPGIQVAGSFYHWWRPDWAATGRSEQLRVSELHLGKSRQACLAFRNSRPRRNGQQHLAPEISAAHLHFAGGLAPVLDADNQAIAGETAYHDHC